MYVFYLSFHRIIIHRFEWHKYFVFKYNLYICCKLTFLTALYLQVPQLFLDGKYVGGEKEITLLHQSGDLGKMLVTSGSLKWSHVTCFSTQTAFSTAPFLNIYVTLEILVIVFLLLFFFYSNILFLHNLICSSLLRILL